MMMTMMMKAPFCSPPLVDQSDFSTGYLEDALLEFSEPSKRRRVLLYTDNEINHSATTTSVLEKVPTSLSLLHGMPCFRN